MTSVFSAALRGRPSSHLFTSALQKSVEEDVLKGRFGTSGLEDLSQVLCELGADSKGYLGVYLCPYGTKTKNNYVTLESWVVYEKTVAVWAVCDDVHGKRVRLLSTDKFSRWLRENLLGESPSSTAQSRINEIAKASSQISPSSSISQIAARPSGRNVPPPSSIGSQAQPALRDRRNPTNLGHPLSSAAQARRRVVPNPSVVNTVTGDNLFYQNRLARAEHEFVDTPRVVDNQGQKQFDPEEFVRRADELDAARIEQGLPPLGETVTPSTYRR
jgi:hypothetical protein